MTLGIEFDSESSKDSSRRPAYAGITSEEKGITGWLIGKNIVRDRTQASYMLMAVVLVCIAAILITWKGSDLGIGSGSQKYDPAEETRKAREKYGIR